MHDGLNGTEQREPETESTSTERWWGSEYCVVYRDNSTEMEIVFV